MMGAVSIKISFFIFLFPNIFDYFIVLLFVDIQSLFILVKFLNKSKNKQFKKDVWFKFTKNLNSKNGKFDDKTHS